MDSDSPLSNLENNETKPEFRKLTNDAANRKYRRHSPVAGSSEEDGSPKRDHSSRGNSKVSDFERRNGDRVNDKTSSRSRGGDSYRHSSRSNHSRHDDHSRHGKYADDDDRGHAKPPSRSTRESSDYNRSRDYYRDADRYSRDRSDAADRKYKTGYDGRHGSRYDDRDRRARDRDGRDEKRDHRSSRDHRSDRTTYNEDSRGNQTDSSKRESGELKDKNDELDGHEASESQDLAVKRAKFNLGETDAREVDERHTSAKNGGEHVVKVTAEQVTVNVPGTTTVDAAKVAAMKAAELVNKNLSSTGFMTADQKKKLLWGSKKNSSTEESSHRWDTTMFPDRERQEKFNKLMGLKGEVKVDTKAPSSQDAEKVQLDLEKQYTAGLRRRDGRTVGLGL